MHRPIASRRPEPNTFRLLVRVCGSLAELLREMAGGRGVVMGLILVVILVLLLLAVVPAWPYSRRWGPAPGGLIGTILIVVLILWLLGVL